jgi:hypothetical protein
MRMGARQTALVKMNPPMGQNMLSDFDQNTIANMTAALDHICKRIPAKRDSAALRKRIADELIVSARLGKRTLGELENAGLNIMKSLVKQPKYNWLWFRRS